MANICLYKIKVKGRRRACYALVDMMPLYSCEKELLNEHGTDDDYELSFLGDCKWSVGTYTTPLKNPIPFTEEELNSVEDGDYWNTTLKDKSVLLDCEIWCNSKDIDSYCYAVYEHYNRGEQIFDECPKELHIKRGRDYDEDECFIREETQIGKAYKVKFERGTHIYTGGDYQVGDIVMVSGSKEGLVGRIIDIYEDQYTAGMHIITRLLGHASKFDEDEIMSIYAAQKPADRKAYLEKLGLDTATTKKKFVSIMDYQWTEFALERKRDWETFIRFVRDGNREGLGM